MTKRISTAAIVVSAALASMPALAQSPKPGADCTSWATANNIDKKLCGDAARFIQSNNAVPESPAFSMLGVSSENVVRPTSPNQLGLSVLNGVDPNGNFQSGIAVETAPFMLFAGDTITLQDYQKSDSIRILANTQISLATVKGTDSDDESQRLAMGLHITPWDKGDPRLNDDIVKCFADGLDNALKANEKPLPKSVAKDPILAEAYRKQLTEAAQKDVKSCRTKAKAATANASAWTIGLTSSYFSRSGDLDDLDQSGFALWSSLALNPKDFGFGGPLLDSSGAAVLHVRYRTDEQVAIENGNSSFYKRDSIVAGLGWRFGSPTLAFTVEGSFVDANNEDRADDTFYQFNAKVEYQVPNSNIWLTGNLGTSSDRADGDDTALRVSLNWAFNDDSK
jgi:hypothetical protein